MADSSTPPDPATSTLQPTLCSSCGDDAPLTEVRRMYVTPAAWDTEGKVEPAADTEHWCLTCLMHYPHQIVGDSADGEGLAADTA